MTDLDPVRVGLAVWGSGQATDPPCSAPLPQPRRDSHPTPPAADIGDCPSSEIHSAGSFAWTLRCPPPISLLIHHLYRHLRSTPFSTSNSSSSLPSTRSRRDQQPLLLPSARILFVSPRQLVYPAEAQRPEPPTPQSLSRCRASDSSCTIDICA